MRKTNIEDCKLKLRRWLTRLTRATNMVNQLERRRRRLVTPTPAPVRRPAPSRGVVAQAITESATPLIDDGIPAFLDRRDPVVAEAMTAARKAAEADARKAMPLTGRAALDAIRPKRKKANAAV